MERAQHRNEGLIYKVTALSTKSTWFSSSTIEGCIKYWDDIMKGQNPPEEPLMMSVTDTFSNSTIVLKIYI